jgi:peptidoglycan/LPS O-acetylase OafA/YrhL
LSATKEIAIKATAPPPGSARIRMEFLDGLRGLSALYVVFFHIQLIMTWRGDGGGLPEPLLLSTLAMRFGRYAVAVFIVLSGYCLMLPVARSADARLRGGAWEYLKRRARRILPPYYAALVLTLMLIAVVPGLRRPQNVWWDHALPAFTPDVLLSHLFLIHNFSPEWHLKIDGSLWSVATEWQIYFLFPALLLPVWRRFGLVAVLAAAFAVGLAPHFFLNNSLDEAAPWFLGLFAMGMAGAVVGFTEGRLARALRIIVPWHLVSAVFGLLFLSIAVWDPSYLWRSVWLMDIIVGIAATSLIIYFTHCRTQKTGQPLPVMLELLEARGTVALGRFSYSLYLVHAPVLGGFHLYLRSLNLPPAMTFAVLFGAGLPLCLGLSYLFHLAFERRFIPEGMRSNPSGR